MPKTPNPDLADRILSKLRKSKRKYSLCEKLRNTLDADDRDFEEALDRLVLDGRVVRAAKGKLGLCERLDLLSGRLQVGRTGKAVMIPDVPDAPVRIDSRRLRPAIDGDRVLVEVEPYRSGRGLRRGTIHSILERGRKTLVGVVSEDRPGTLEPYGRPLGYVVVLRGQEVEAGETVAARIIEYPTSHADITAEIESALGPAGNLDTEVRAACYSRGIPEEFPDEALALARRLGAPGDEELRDRRDLRAHTTMTIDGADARDFDDAVAIEKRSRGYTLTVSIADVSHYVRPNDALDQSAFERGTSVYFPHRAVPMLPAELSDDLASLRQDQDRLTLSVFLDIDAQGRVQATDFAASVINSNARLTYEQAEEVIVDGRDGPFGVEVDKGLRLMHECAELLRRQRMARGALDLDLAEGVVVLDANDRPLTVDKRPRLASHRLIEEFMIAANEAVARYLQEREVGFLYRIHERPDEDDVSSLTKRLSGLGLRLPTRTGPPEPADLQTVLTEVVGRPHEALVNLFVLRALTQARYSAHRDQHFGLASKCYTHFTSPIRRYPDLIAHRALAAVLAGRDSELPAAAALESTAEHCSRCERRAMDAERDIVKAATVLIMKAHVGRRMRGTVSGVERFGYFVELDDLYAEGFVPIGRLSEYYEFVRERMELISRVSDKTIRVGDRADVIVSVADLPTRTLEFEPVPGEKA